MAVLGKNFADGCLLITMEKRAYCVNCNSDLNPGDFAWSYLEKPVGGNYVECFECRYGNGPDTNFTAVVKGEEN